MQVFISKAEKVLLNKDHEFVMQPFIPQFAEKIQIVVGKTPKVSDGKKFIITDNTVIAAREFTEVFYPYTLFKFLFEKCGFAA
jgi:hypothetical protein